MISYFKTLTIMVVAFIVLLFVLPFAIPINQKEINPNQLPYPNSSLDTINGVMLHYRIFEPEKTSKGNVALIHGFSSSTFCWRKNIDTLTANGFKVVAIDVPAFGFSDKSTHVNNSNTARSEVLFGLLNKIDAQKKWVLVGHSMGGGIVTTMAALYPNRTQALVLVDGVGFDIKKDNHYPISRFLLANRFTFRWAEVGLKYIFLNPKLFRKLLSSAYGQEADSESVAGYMQPFYLRNSGAAIFAMVGNSKEVKDVAIKNIKCPKLIIWGSKDTWVPIKSGELFKKRLPDTQFIIIEGAGHACMETHPLEFNRELVKFLNNNPEK